MPMMRERIKTCNMVNKPIQRLKFQLSLLLEKHKVYISLYSNKAGATQVQLKMCD